MGSCKDPGPRVKTNRSEPARTETGRYLKADDIAEPRESSQSDGERGCRTYEAYMDEIARSFSSEVRSSRTDDLGRKLYSFELARRDKAGPDDCIMPDGDEGVS